MKFTQSLIFIVVFIASSYATSTFGQNTRNYDTQISTLIRFLNTYYVDEVSDAELMDAAMAGVLKSLDPHSVYLTAREFEEMKVDTSGQFAGLGMRVSMDDGLVKVIAPIEDTPAHKAGIKAGDYITHVDGELVYDMKITEAVDLMRGPIGTDCIITVYREELEKPFDVTITRETIKVDVVKSRAEGNVAYIRITLFNEQTYNMFIEAWSKLYTELGSEMEGLIIDLRNNPGGLLGSALAISDSFIKEGEIVSIRPRNEDEAESFNATPNIIAKDLPIVVLINTGSASASEIVAGALQDYNRALIVGTQSFGKGSVQSIVPFEDGSAIKLTTSRYYTPSGRSIQAVGITPDVIVRPGKVEYEDEGKLRKEANLRGRLENRGVVIEPETQITEVEDYQLQRALDLVRGIAHYIQP